MAIKKVFHSKKLPVRAVSLISYDLLIDFTLENEQTINGFYNAYKAKCEKEFGMKSDDVITLNSWKLAVQVFWRDILKLDLLKSFSCDSSKDNWFFLWTFLFLSQVVDLDLMQAMKATIRDRSRRKVLATSSNNRYSRLSIPFGRKFSQVSAMKK